MKLAQLVLTIKITGDFIMNKNELIKLVGSYIYCMNPINCSFESWKIKSIEDLHNEVLNKFHLDTVIRIEGGYISWNSLEDYQSPGTAASDGYKFFSIDKGLEIVRNYRNDYEYRNPSSNPKTDIIIRNTYKLEHHLMNIKLGFRTLDSFID